MTVARSFESRAQLTSAVLGKLDLFLVSIVVMLVVIFREQFVVLSLIVQGPQCSFMVGVFLLR